MEPLALAPHWRGCWSSILEVSLLIAGTWDREKGSSAQEYHNEVRQPGASGDTPSDRSRYILQAEYLSPTP